MKTLKTVDIIKIQNGTGRRMRDTIIREEAYTLYVNDEEVVTLVCTPSHLEELTAGFMGAEGFISRGNEISDLVINHNDGLIWTETTRSRPEGFLQRSITSCCGRGRASFYFRNDAENIKPVAGETKVSPRQLALLAHKMEEKGRLFLETGGTHGAALCSAGDILCFFEDVGRHNAVDKIFGHCLLREIPRADKLLALTGRISSEILLKAARMNIPVLVSRAAPTHLALELAEQLGVTVVGFVRGNSLNIYTHPERIRG